MIKIECTLVITGVEQGFAPLGALIIWKHLLSANLGALSFECFCTM